MHERSELECDSVECSPLGESDLFACGKYHLDDAGDRVGAISLYKYAREGKSILEQSTVPRAGVLDCKWNKDGTKLATAEADGRIGLFNLKETALEFSADFQLPQEPITLAVDWNYEGNILGSYSDGSVVITEGVEELRVTNQFIAHEAAEVWAVACSKHSPNLFYTGIICLTLRKVLT